VTAAHVPPAHHVVVQVKDQAPKPQDCFLPTSFSTTTFPLGQAKLGGAEDFFKNPSEGPLPVPPSNNPFTSSGSTFFQGAGAPCGGGESGAEESKGGPSFPQQMMLPLPTPPAWEGRVKTLESITGTLQEKLASFQPNCIEALHEELFQLKKALIAVQEYVECVQKSQKYFQEQMCSALNGLDRSAVAAAAAPELPAAVAELPAPVAELSAPVAELPAPVAELPAPELPADSVPTVSLDDNNVDDIRIVHVGANKLAKFRGLTDAELRLFKVQDLKEALAACGKPYPGLKDAAIAILKSCLATT
jgi:hypothetical protein